MAGDRYSIKDQNEVHFSTFTVVNWMDIFIREVYRTIIIESLNFCVVLDDESFTSYCKS